jgi:hypothetical protein
MTEVMEREEHGCMDLPQIWPLLSTSTRSWLVDHNGEALPEEIVTEILAITGDQPRPTWWSGPTTDGDIQLTDEAVDWIEGVANDEGQT